MSSRPHERPHIGIFDSGVGGLSVLRALRAALPAARLSYVADTANAPYGERDEAFIVQRSLAIGQALHDQGATLLVVACNTATAAAVEALRQRWPHWPIVGVEPGLKPALAASATRRVAVMATPATLASDKFRRLLQAHGRDAVVHLQPCPGLAAAIERADPRDPELQSLLDRFSADLRAARVDTVVLGCTHYPFVAQALAERLPPHTQLIDTADAVARRAVQLLGDAAAPDDAAGEVRLWSTGESAPLERLARQGLDLTLQAQHLAA